ncbi:ABC transporter substrate-binding protein [Pseudochelatococcus sp. B33]
MERVIGSRDRSIVPLIGQSSRRGFLTSAACLTTSLWAFRAHASPLRVVSLDAALTQTMLALGVAPLAISNRSFYRRFVIEPVLPPDTMELGTRAEPNIELLAELRPDQILYCPEFGELPDAIADITRKSAIPIYTPGARSFFANAQDATRQVGDAIGRRSSADSYIGRVDALLESSRIRLANFVGATFCLFTFLTDRRVRLYTDRSLLSGALARLGIRNIVTEAGNNWGSIDVGMETLAAYEATRFVHIGDMPLRTTAGPLWGALPFVREGRLSSVPANWMFGGLPSVERFARAFVPAMEARLGRRG